MNWVDKLKEGLGACPKCHSFGRKIIWDEPYQLQIEGLSKPEFSTPYSEVCKSCNYVFSRGEKSDVIKRIETEPDNLPTMGHYEVEVYYNKNGERIGTGQRTFHKGTQL